MFSLGIDRILNECPDWIRGKKIGLLTHPASLDRMGRHTADRLKADPEIELTCLFGPEHGVTGTGDAGEEINSSVHPTWGIPIYSLYGESRKPTPAMLDKVDVLLTDLQDLGVRCYTYVSTLRLVMEAAAEAGKAVVVCDRPVPQPGVVDGPMLDPEFESFVGCVNLPLQYGMTPGETALFLKQDLHLNLDLRVAPGRRDGPDEWPGAHWCPPSPGIRSPETARIYPVTVFCEALPALDCWRSGLLPFQVLGAPWFEPEKLCDALGNSPLLGISFHPFWCDGPNGELIQAVRMVVTDRTTFRPIETAIWLLHLIQQTYGPEKLWNHPETREAFFDNLMGTDSVRKALQANASPEEIIESWQPGLASFKASISGS